MSDDKWEDDPAKYARAFERHSRAKRLGTAGNRIALAAHLEKTYGLSLQAYERLAEDQGGVCAVCRRPPKPGRRLCVDHDHHTGMVRALLCGACNSALGILGEDAERLWLLVDYADHCAQVRKRFTAHPIKFALAQAYKQSTDHPARRKLLLEAIQRLHNEPVGQVMGGRRGRIVAKVLEDFAAPIASLPEVAAVRAGAVHDAVYV